MALVENSDLGNSDLGNSDLGNSANWSFFHLNPRVALGMTFLIPGNLLFSIPTWNFSPFIYGLF